ncbi:hypothetical protein [Flavivirga algicola]|uniref:Lipoprotein n=1 Tax=Flavivirga algicola TaxID=2729136 RepID=A0ABX1S551_9FLAO|nr:hypothetical protein [Flavivirga algicola]NMH89797.1 hypothetical protein [Flavivirga algicola]
MKKIIIIPILLLIISCGSKGLSGEYTCETSNGEFGSVIRFKEGGKLFLDLIPSELAKRNPELGSKLDVPGEYEIVDDKVIIKYFDGYQTHTLTKIDDKLTSTSDLFKLCTCKTE